MRQGLVFNYVVWVITSCETSYENVTWEKEEGRVTIERKHFLNLLIGNVLYLSIGSPLELIDGVVISMTTEKQLQYEDGETFTEVKL